MKTRTCTVFHSVRYRGEAFFSGLLSSCKTFQDYLCHPLSLPFLVLQRYSWWIDFDVKTNQATMRVIEDCIGERDYGTLHRPKPAPPRGAWDPGQGANYQELNRRLIGCNFKLNNNVENLASQMLDAIADIASKLEKLEEYTPEMALSWKHIGIQLDFIKLRLQSCSCATEQIRRRLTMQSTLVRDKSTLATGIYLSCG